MIVKRIFLNTEERCVAALQYLLTVPESKLAVQPTAPEFDFKKTPQPKQVDAK